MNETRFEWDDEKDRVNQKKHGIPFALAQLAFLDPRRVIAVDKKHSLGEARYYCIGRVGDGVMTVRFTYSNNIISLFGAGYGRKGKQIYGAKNQIHSNENMGNVRAIGDFLPSLAQLALKEEKVKVTISLSKSRLEFFKSQASRYHTANQ